jgi:hypothetical protein
VSDKHTTPALTHRPGFTSGRHYSRKLPTEERGGEEGEKKRRRERRRKRFAL